MLDWLFGIPTIEPMDYQPWTPQAQQAPQMSALEWKYTQQALALHPDAPPEFNLQPTIDMLRTADLYGFDVVRRK